MKHRRWLSVILALCMLAGFVPAFADELPATDGYDPADVYTADAENDPLTENNDENDDENDAEDDVSDDVSSEDGGSEEGDLSNELPAADEVSDSDGQPSGGDIIVSNEQPLTIGEPVYTEEPTIGQPAAGELFSSGDLRIGAPVVPVLRSSPMRSSEGTMTWASVQEVFSAGGSVILTNDIVAGSSDGPLTVPEGINVTLDLNGYTLDRGLSSASAPITAGHVILVRGTLTITDGGIDGTGKITGGFAKNGGGVNNSGTLYLQGGSIAGNRAMYTDNDTEGRGGGIMNYGTLIMTGGSVTNNSGYLGGGINIKNDGHNLSVSITGGTVSGNQASGNGGGIYCYDGITFSVSGSPVVKDNLNGNVYLAGRSVITVAGTLDFAANLDVSAENMPRAVTSGFSASNSSVYVFTLAYGSLPVKVENGEIVSALTYAAEVSTWDELQAAMNNDANKDKTIVLTDDLDGTNKDTLLLEGSSKNITVDLAGHKIDMHRTEPGSGKHVFEAKGGAVLTIIDSAGNGGITGGYGYNGGGIYVNDDSAVYLYNVTVYGNKVRISDWSPNGDVEDGMGGGIFVKGTLSARGCVIKGNEAKYFGGGIYSTNDAILYLESTLIEDNVGVQGAGAYIKLNDNTSVIKNCRITDNAADSSKYSETLSGGSPLMRGGGIYLDAKDKTLTVSDTVIDGNTAIVDGGGIVRSIS